MKIINKIIILLVGSLFIFSGLIKLNDPVGTKIKLEEYFEVFADDLKDKPAQIVINGQAQPIPNDQIKETSLSKFMYWLRDYAIIFSVLMCALEVILGVNLLTGHRIRFTIWALFLMVLFFTFLTFYSWHYNKVTDCGCFGEAIKLKPVESFIKDIVLVVLIGILMLQQKKITPNLPPQWGARIDIVNNIACFGLGLYAIYYLPPIDLLPYKVGNSIPAQMKPSEPLRYSKEKYVFTNLKTQKDEQSEAWEDKFNDTLTYKYKSYDKELLNPEAKAKVTDFAVTGADTSLTQKLFKGNRLLILVPDLEKSHLQSLKNVGTLADELKKMNIETWLLTNSTQQMEAVRHEYRLAFPAYGMDGKVLKTMIRTSPGIMILKDGVVKGKFSYMSIPSAQEVQALLAP